MITLITFFIFFSERGFDYAAISVAYAILFIVQTFTEIPTGIIADVYGRKFSTLIGLCGEIIILIGLLLSNSVIAVYIFFALWGICRTLVSGADDAWALENHDHLTETAIKKYYTSSAVFYNIGMVFAGLLSTVLLLKTDHIYVWIARIALTVLSVIILMFIAEKTPTKKRIFSAPSLRHIVSEGFRTLRQNTSLTSLMLAEFFIVISIFLAGFSTTQDYLKSSDVSIEYWGIFFAIVYALNSIAPIIGLEINKKFTHRMHYLIIVIFLQALLFIAAGILIHPYFAIIFLIVNGLLEDLFNPINSALIQNEIPGRIRATLTSFHSTILGISYAIGIFFGGMITSVYGAQYSFLCAALFLCPALIIYIGKLYSNPYLKKK